MDGQEWTARTGWASSAHGQEGTVKSARLRVDGEEWTAAELRRPGIGMGTGPRIDVRLHKVTKRAERVRSGRISICQMLMQPKPPRPGPFCHVLQASGGAGGPPGSARQRDLAANVTGLDRAVRLGRVIQRIGLLDHDPERSGGVKAGEPT